MSYTLPSLQKVGLDKVGKESSFITVGTNGILTIRMETSGGYVYDMSVDDRGAWTYTLVSSPSSTAGTSMGLLLSLTYPT